MFFISGLKGLRKMSEILGQPLKKSDKSEIRTFHIGMSVLDSDPYLVIGKTLVTDLNQRITQLRRETLWRTNQHR
jgi:hypothetical protein